MTQPGMFEARGLPLARDRARGWGAVRTLSAGLLCLGAMTTSAVAVDIASLTTEQLRTPDPAVESVRQAEQRGYTEALAAYIRARDAYPDDVELAVAQCRFMQRFAWSEESDWADIAAKDLENCKTTLEGQYGTRPEAMLFLLESHYGKEAISFGEPMVARASGWTDAQRARLHTALARAYTNTRDDTRAGEHALLAVQLAPASDQLVTAIRYLAKSKRVDEAVALLTAAPLPKTAWLESARIKAAAEWLPADAARRELQRAQQAGLKIDAHTTARALRRAGDHAGAQAALSTDTSLRANEVGEQRQLRLDVAFEAGATAAVADALGDWVRKSGAKDALAYPYARLLVTDPKAALRTELFPLAGWLLAFTLALVLWPGVVMFPAHYRGTVRARLGKPQTVLFARIGLRHAWLALAVLVFALTLVPVVRFGGELGTGSVLAEDVQRRFAIGQLWATGFAAVGLIWCATRLSWREWLGSGRWKFRWFIPALCCLAFVTFAMVVGRHALQVSSPDAHVAWMVGMIQGANALGGLPLALGLVAVLVPICEELVFRGCMLGGLSRHISFGWANVLQAAAFTALHQDPRRVVFYFLLAIIAGVLARKTRGLAAPILLHAANNAIVTLAVLH